MSQYLFLIITKTAVNLDINDLEGYMVCMIVLFIINAIFKWN